MRSMWTKCALFGCSMYLLFYMGGVSARPIPIDGYAATVNDRVITVGDVLTAMEPVRQQLQILADGEELERRLSEAYETILESLIERALIIEEFKAQGGTIPDRIVDDYINQVISDRFTNRVTLLKALQEQRLTWEEWRNEMRDRLVVNQMRQREVSARVVITPQQEREAYERDIERYTTPEEVWVRLIGLQKGMDAEEHAIKKAEAERLRERILAGEDFAAIARTESEGPKASDGGDQGWRKPEEYSGELAEIIRTLEPGQVSPVVETAEMYFLVKVEGRKKAAIVPFEDVRAQIQEQLRRQEEERLYKMWIEQLRNKHHVQVLKRRLTDF